MTDEWVTEHARRLGRETPLTVGWWTHQLQAIAHRPERDEMLKMSLASMAVAFVPPTTILWAMES